MDIHALIAGTDLEAVKAAVRANPNLINQLNDEGLPPLYTAALHGNKEAIRWLLDHEAAVDAFACGYLGLESVVELMLRFDPSAARQTLPNGLTPLHFASRAGHATVVRLLLKAGADVNAEDNRGVRPLEEACHGGPWKPAMAKDVVQVLLDHGAEVDVFSAAAMGRVDLIEKVLGDSDAMVNDVDRLGRTALAMAVHNNHLTAARFLIERGADVNQGDIVGDAALHCTSQQCDKELIHLLVEHGAEAHLCCYVACGDLGRVQRVIDENPQSINEKLYEYNAVQYAIHCWELKILRLLIANGAELTAEDQAHILRISQDPQLLRELMGT